MSFDLTFEDLIELKAELEAKLEAESRLLTSTEQAAVMGITQVGALIGVRVGDVDGTGFLAIPDRVWGEWCKIARYDLIDQEGLTYLKVGRYHVIRASEPKVRDLLRIMGWSSRDPIGIARLYPQYDEVTV